MTDTCVDPQSVKIITGLPVAYANKGMAWPEAYRAVFDLIDQRVDSNLAVSSLDAADARWLLTDSACADDWPARYAARLESPVSVGYPGGEITLWRVAAG